MFGDLSALILWPFISRFFLGLIILSLSSIALAVHFKLGNSLSIIQDWFRVNLIEVVTYSSLIQFGSRVYFGREKFIRKRSKPEDKLLLINYFTIFFFIVFALGIWDFSSFLREGLFYCSFFMIDFMNNNKRIDSVNRSLRLSLFKIIYESFLLFLMFYIFFGANKEFSYCFILFYFGLAATSKVSKWGNIKIVKYYAPIVFFLIVVMKQSIFFPENEVVVLISSLTFFSFNLVTFIWHRYSTIRQPKKGLWTTN